MPNETHTELNEKLVYQHLCYVTDEETAWVLLQEPGFIGFGVVQKDKKDKVCWPPYVQQLDWLRVRDLRLFGEKGEWHVWPHWDGGWKSRLLKLEDIKDALTEYHALWGTQVKCEKAPWIKLTEDRGTEIWLPLQGQVKDCEKNSDLPLRLKIKQVVGYDPKYHLAGIIDAALVGLVPQASETPLLPDESLLC